MANATIYDVSELAEVSIATVSRVLNTPERVSKETRSRVISAIDELGFSPKFEAVARARKALGRIGILTPTFTSDSFVERLRGIVATLSGLPFEPILYDVTSDAQRDGYLANLPTTHQVDGLIAIDLPLDEAAADRLLQYELPTIQIASAVQASNNPGITTIIHDDASGGHMAAEYLFEQGHRSFGYIGDTGLAPFLGITKDQKLDAFRQSLALNGVALPDSHVQLGPFGLEAARRSARRLLDLASLPSAIFTGSDTQAIGVLSAVRERGLKVPGDIAVMGFDDIEVAEFLGLTTIHQQLRESGRLAVTLLLEQLQNANASAQSVHLPFTLIERETA